MFCPRTSSFFGDVLERVGTWLGLPLPIYVSISIITITTSYQYNLDFRFFFDNIFLVQIQQLSLTFLVLFLNCKPFIIIRMCLAPRHSSLLPAFGQFVPLNYISLEQDQYCKGITTPTGVKLQYHHDLSVSPAAHCCPFCNGSSRKSGT